MSSEDETTENAAAAPAETASTEAESPPTPAKDEGGESETAEAPVEGSEEPLPADGGEEDAGDAEDGAEGGAEAEAVAEESDDVVLPLQGIPVDLGEGDFPPKGCLPIDLSDSTCARWGMKWGDMIGESFKSIALERAIVQEEVDRMAVACDFYTYHKQLKKFKGDKILLIMAPRDNELDVNYVWANAQDKIDLYTAQITATTEALHEEQRAARAEAKAAAKAARIAEGGDDADGEDDEDDEMEQMVVTEYVDKPIIAREYEELGASVEVDHMHVTNSRPLLGFYISQERKFFNARCDFSDIEVDKPPSYNHQKTQYHNLRRLESDMGFQCATGSTDVSAQTLWSVKYNKASQYEPIRYTERLKDRIMKSSKMQNFLAEALELVELNLQHNETLDLFKGEFSEFVDDEYSLGNKKENNLKPWHSFTHLTYSKNRIISGINWHPSKSGVVAFSCTNNLTFDQWVDISGKVLTSSILIWNFQDLLHPQYILMAPGDLCCFSINPKNANIIVGGLMTGQLVLWDLTEQNKKLDSQKLKKDSSDHDWDRTPPVEPTHVSRIDKSHARGVSCIKWLPDNAQVNKRGEYSEVEDSLYPTQFVTVAGDGHLFFWDSRPNQWKNPAWVSKEAAEGLVSWMAHASIPLTKPDSSGSICATKISGGDGTNIVVVTEDGEIAVVDWAAKSSEEKKNAVGKYFKGHVGACTAIERSPHFPNMYMTVGDWTFTIWQFDDTNQKEPVFKSAPASHQLTTGCWSPTRAGLIVVALADGTIQLWDLLDQCHKPSLTFPSGSESICSMQFWQSKLQAQQYLAVGDNDGKLHVIEIPRNLRKPINHENEVMQLFYQREIKKVDYAAERKEIRGKDKKEAGGETTQKKKPDGETLQLGDQKDPMEGEETEEEKQAEEAYQKSLNSWKGKLCEEEEEDAS